MVIVNSETPAMEVLNDDVIETIGKVLGYMNKKVYISKIDYHLGEITLGYVYNAGTEKEWHDDNVLEISVAYNSLGSTIHDVIRAAFNKFVM